MKKLVFVAIVSTTFLFSCNEKNSGYTINGTIESIEDGEKVYIEIPNEEGMPSAIDTAIVENGKFKFIGKAEQIEMAYLQIGSLQGKIRFILENATINITAYKDSLDVSKVEGSYQTDELTKFNKGFEVVQNKAQQYQMDNMQAYQKAAEEDDTETINRIREEFSVIQDQTNDYMKSYASENPKSYVSLLLLQQLVGDLDGFENVKTSFEALSEELKSTKKGKELQEKIESLLAVAIGQVAPDFSAPNPEGQMVSLKESLGKVTLIDFWASWCGPCRMENPNVVAMYNEFHEKGLNIIGVSLDREGQKDKWLEAIETDKLTWTHVSNLKFWQDPIAVQYGIQSIPATLLLDADGKIIAKNLRGNELREKVAELLTE